MDEYAGRFELFDPQTQETVSVLDGGEEGVSVEQLDEVADRLGLPRSGLFLRAVVETPAAITDEATILYLGTSVRHYVRIDVPNRTAATEGLDLTMPLMSFDILATLAMRPNTVISRQQICKQAGIRTMASLRVHIFHLRKALGDTHRGLVQSVHSRGLKGTFTGFDSEELDDLIG